MRWQQLAAIAGAAVVSVAAADPASAQPKTGQRYEGLYIGAEAGIGRLDLEASPLEDTGFTYGGYLGWRTRAGENFVLGLEARASDSGAEDRREVLIQLDRSDPNIALGRSLGIDAVAGLTLGRDDWALLFASGGYLNTKITGAGLGLSDAQTAVVFPAFSRSEDGYRLGGGVEARLWNNLAVRATGHFADTGPVDQVQVLGSLVYDF